MSGLQTAVDARPSSGTSDQFYVVEFSANLPAGAPGRVLRVDATRET